MLGKRIAVEDMQSVDADFYQSLVYVRDNDPEPLDMTFQVRSHLLLHDAYPDQPHQQIHIPCSDTITDGHKRHGRDENGRPETQRGQHPRDRRQQG